MGKPKGSRNKKTLENLHTINTHTSHRNRQRYEDMTPSESMDNALNEGVPSFNETVSMSPPPQQSTNSASQMELDQSSGFGWPTEGLGAPSFPTFPQFETPIEFGPMLDFDKPDSALSWNPEAPHPPGTARKSLPGQRHVNRRQSHISNDGDNETREEDKLDAFNSFTDACLRQPLSSASSLPTATESIPSSVGSSRDTQSSSESARSNARGAICACLQSQAEQLCRLRAIEQRKQPVTLDMMLHHTRLVMKSSEKLLHCTICRNDRQVLQLTVMVLQSVFGWIDCLCCNEPSRHAGLEVILGSYPVSDEESNLIQTLLTSRILGKCKTVLNVLATRVEQTTDDGSSLERFNTKYLQHSSRLLTQSLMEMMRHFHLPDIRQQSVRGGGSNSSKNNSALNTTGQRDLSGQDNRTGPFAANSGMGFYRRMGVVTSIFISMKLAAKTVVPYLPLLPFTNLDALKDLAVAIGLGVADFSAFFLLSASSTPAAFSTSFATFLAFAAARSRCSSPLPSLPGSS